MEPPCETFWQDIFRTANASLATTSSGALPPGGGEREREQEGQGEEGGRRTKRRKPPGRYSAAQRPLPHKTAAELKPTRWAHPWDLHSQGP